MPETTKVGTQGPRTGTGGERPPLRDFLEISYDELEALNLEAKALRAARTPPDRIQEARIKYLTDERRIKAVTVCFSDLEGRLHMLDYDKKFLLSRPTT
jgi:glutamine synthetase